MLDPGADGLTPPLEGRRCGDSDTDIVSDKAPNAIFIPLQPNMFIFSCNAQCELLQTIFSVKTKPRICAEGV